VLRVGARLADIVELTDDRAGAAHAYLTRLERVILAEALPALDDLLDVPYVLLGTETEIVDQLRAHRRRWGFSRYTVRAGTLDAVGGLIARLGAPPPR